MAKNKKLGMGLELLLNVGEGRDSSNRESGSVNDMQKIMNQALLEDEAKNLCEAYHLYRQIIDQAVNLSKPEKEISALISKAYNNAAIILYELGNLDQAIEFLRKSLEIQPENYIAKENLNQLIKIK